MGTSSPGDGPEVIKEEPVSLGRKGKKKHIRRLSAGEHPGSSPISIFLNGEMDTIRKSTHGFTFGGLGSSIEAVAGGTLGETSPSGVKFALTVRAQST